MGLDVLLYDNTNKLISIYELDKELHNEIFSTDKRWASYSFLRKLHDYYRTNEEFNGEGLEGLISDLNNYKPLMAEKYHTAVELLLEAVSDKKVQKIRINGD
ncbi:hypothetical protein [Paenibacillus sp. Soil522]|uniref:hypothetical protein n=1 Tax=Paenibacillus sp. Soil522 TaxID=1736388 RepID=UPI0006F32DF1|nr:hypothetical protein [Paenibacillus sp. Soil522]KRE28208.1 hypothetical protein ASG81_26760 [Paenibacillus sp. Soil522]